MIKIVAMHTTASVTKSGHYCARFPDSLIVIGNKPVGPRGGHCGQWVDGKVVARFKYSDREFADRYIKNLVLEGFFQM